MAATRFVFGSYSLDPCSGLLARQNEPVPLALKSARVLSILVERRGKLVSKEELLNAVWPDAVVEESNLTQTIHVLRKTLGTAGGGPYIETVPKRGYRFVAPVELVELPEAVPAVAATSAGHSRPWRRVGIVAAGTIVLTGLGWFVLGARAPQPAVRSLVVIPFLNLSGDAEQEFLADGLTDSLTTEMARSRDVRVVSRSSAMYYKGARKRAPEIAGELKVEGVLQGSVVRTGDRVRVNIQLVDGRTDTHLWSEAYDRQMHDLPSLHTEIARAISGGVHVRLSGESPRQRTTSDWRAFEAYLRGRHALHRRTPAEILRAISYFHASVDADAAYAAAYAGLADAYNQLGTVLIGEKPPRETRPLAIAAAEKAIEIDAQLGEAHAALGFAKLYDWQWDAAERELRRAIELSPGYGSARIWLASYLLMKGRTEEALAQVKFARDLDPLSLIVQTQVGWVYHFTGRFDDAISEYQRVLERQPNYVWALWQLGEAQIYKGDLNRAQETLERAAQVSGRNPVILGFLGCARAKAGEKRGAAEILDELTAMSQKRYVSPAAFTSVYVCLGDNERTFDSMEKELHDRANSVAWWGAWPMLDPIRRQPRGQQLLRKAGLLPPA